MAACYKGYHNCVKLLLEHHANMQISCHESKMSPLMRACRYGGSNSVECVQLLMAVKTNAATGGEVNDVDVDGSMNDVDVDGNSAIAFACFKSKCVVVRILLENGAKVNVSNANGHTPLHACFMRPAATEAKDNTCDDDDNEALLRVKQCVQLLLDAGADIAATNTKGETALDKCDIFGIKSPALRLLLSLQI